MERRRSRSRWNMDKSSLQSGLSRKPDRWDTMAPRRGRRRWNMARSSSSERSANQGRGSYYLSFCWSEQIDKPSTPSWLFVQIFQFAFNSFFSCFLFFLFFLLVHSRRGVLCLYCLERKQRKCRPYSRFCLCDCGLKTKMTSVRKSTVSTNLFL